MAFLYFVVFVVDDLKRLPKKVLRRSKPYRNQF